MVVILRGVFRWISAICRPKDRGLIISVYLIYGRNKKFDVMAEKDWTGRQGDVRNWGLRGSTKDERARARRERRGRDCTSILKVNPERDERDVLALAFSFHFSVLPWA